MHPFYQVAFLIQKIKKEKIMKRKILLLAMMVAVLSCLFALCVSAETVTYEGQEIELVKDLGDPSWYTGNTALAIQDKESIVILKDAEGNMTAFPSYYILRFGVDVKDGVVTNAYVLWEDQNGVDYSFINGSLNTSYAYGSVYYIEFPYGMTCCKNNRLFGRENGGAKETGCVEIVLPDSVNTIEGQAFRMMDSCRKINIPAAVTSLPNWAFSGSTKLETVVIAEGSLIESTGNCFSNCKALSSINLEACTKLKTLGGGAFEYCTSLRGLNLPDSIETIGDKAFYKIGQFALASDYLPKNLTTIGTHFLSGCDIQNSVLYFPKGFTSLASNFNFNDGAEYSGEGCFTLVFLGKMTALKIDNMDSNSYFKGLQVIFAQNTADELNGKFLEGTIFKDKHAYIAKDSTGALALNKEVTTGTLSLTLRNNDPNSNSEAGKDANGNSIYSINSITPRFIFCGGNDVDFVYQVRNSISGWNYYLTTPFAYDVEAHEAEGVHYNSVVYQEGNCGYDEKTTKTCVICDLVTVVDGVKATGEHTYTDDFNCETALDCEVCKLTLAEALAHDIKIVAIYKDGYDAKGVKTSSCQNDGCQYNSGEEGLEALFTCLGYSAAENGDGGIAVGYTVNKTAINTYEEIANVSLNFGVFAISQEKLGTGDVFDENGSLAANAISFDVTGYEYSAFVLKIVGFTDAQKDVKLAMGAYVAVNDGETTEYSYMQDDKKGEKIGDYYFASYNDIVAK